jgi:hypothetical protein
MRNMQRINFGRRRFSFKNGKAVPESMSITERALVGEDERAFTERLMRLYGKQKGTIEIVFRCGRPDYAIISFSNIELSGTR